MDIIWGHALGYYFWRPELEPSLAARSQRAVQSAQRE